jgi:hypothetical protein
MNHLNAVIQPRLVRCGEAINSGGVAIRLNIIILMLNLSVYGPLTQG